MDEAIAQTIIDLLELAGGRSISPADAARTIAGRDEKLWSRQMPAIRRTALAMARRGEIVILRKGKPADLNTLKGIYRISRPARQAPFPSP